MTPLDPSLNHTELSVSHESSKKTREQKKRFEKRRKNKGGGEAAIYDMNVGRHNNGKGGYGDGDGDRESGGRRMDKNNVCVEMP